MREQVLYLLRLWRDGDGADDWRFSLEDLRSRERLSFPTLRSLYDHVAARTDAPGAGRDVPRDEP